MNRLVVFTLLLPLTCLSANAAGLKVPPGTIANDAFKGNRSQMQVAQPPEQLCNSAEMNMLQLQSLIAQRQLAQQLTTQLMEEMDDNAKCVVDNL